MESAPGINKVLAKYEHSEIPTEQFQDLFPIVAIGASAGGLEAIRTLLANLPGDTGMAFIYVQHLSPDHKSQLTEILSKSTQMKVQAIDDLETIKPNHVHVIPYNKAIVVEEGHIKLIPRSQQGNAITIDMLFSSLALAHKERVIGVILSGSASDGTLGMTTIKQEGGTTFAQDSSAQFGSMPESVIAAGVVDYVLSPKDIASELARISSDPSGVKANLKLSNESMIDNKDPDLLAILDAIFKATKVDFKVYKFNTIKRRINRRMLILNMKAIWEYRNVLQTNPEELNDLYHDLLINVTSFFREPDVFQYLQDEIFHTLIEQQKHNGPLRVWVAGCSSGEEVYSLAIILSEIQESKGTNIAIQLFATDLSDVVIEMARKGTYSRQAMEPVSPERIQKYFTYVNDEYRINRDLRDMCVFAKHNLLMDPPFSKIDFISCCNLLIYLENAAQEKVLGTFRYALKPSGYLLLGKSETLGTNSRNFNTVSKRFNVFTPKSKSETKNFPHPPSETEVKPKGALRVKAELPQVKILSPADLDKAIDQALITEYMPASVVINKDLEILQFRGSTGLYLAHAPGLASFHILKLARPDIEFELRNAIHAAIEKNAKIRKSNIELKVHDKIYFVSMEVSPLYLEGIEPLFLIVFQEHDQAHQVSEDNTGENPESFVKDRRIKKLEEEIAAIRLEAMMLARQQEDYNIQLQNTSEELKNTNEELHTINEELATSKEEIESTNEELTTTNQELQARYEQLNEAYEYSEEIIGTIHEAMFILDKDLRIKAGNKVFYENFGLQEEETVGELIFDIASKHWDIPSLHDMLDAILNKNQSFQNFEITNNFVDTGDKILLINARRLQPRKYHEQLILLAISDITEIKQKAVELQLKIQEEEVLKAKIEAYEAADAYIRQAILDAKEELRIQNEKLQESEKRYHSMVEEVQEYSIIYLSKEGIVENWNKGAEKIKGYSSEEIVGKHIRIFYKKPDQENLLPEKLLIEAHDEGTASHEGWRIRQDGSKFWASTVLTAIINEQKELLGYSKVTKDLTEKKLFEDRITAANENLLKKSNQLMEAQELAHIGSWEWDVLNDKIEWSDELFHIYGLIPKDFQADYQHFLEYIHPDDLALIKSSVEEALKYQKNYRIVHRIIKPDNSERVISSTGKVFTGHDGKTIRIAGTAQDITQQKKFEDALQESEERFLTIFESNPVPMTLSETSSDKIVFANKHFFETFGYSKEEVIGSTTQNLNLLSEKETERIGEIILNALNETRSFEELSKISDDEKVELLNQLKQTEEMKNFEVCYTRKNGTNFPALISYETIRIKDKRYTITTYLDISSRKKTEELLKDQNDELEKINNELQSFAYISSHDLQEPLRKIQMFSGRIQEKEINNLSEKGREYFLQIQNAAMRMQQLILDLLAYSRTNSEKREFQHSDLNVMFDDIKEEFKEILEQKHATFIVSELCHTNIIPFQFRQMMVNLLNNSLKFSKPNTPPEIIISSKLIKGSELKKNKKLAGQPDFKIESNKNYCYISFSDNGIGFDPAYQDKIFEVFQRLHSKEQYNGTGIGLAIVKKIVDNHHGIIRASSTPNHGATFEIYMPEEPPA